MYIGWTAAGRAHKECYVQYIIIILVFGVFTISGAVCVFLEDFLGESKSHYIVLPSPKLIIPRILFSLREMTIT